MLGVSASHLAIQLNLTTRIGRLREFFQDRRVRIALSLAVDRAYLNTQFYRGLVTPRQYSPLSMSPQYYPTLSDAYITYDVAQANSLLDEAGYTARDNEGFRLWKDGSRQRLSFTIEGTAMADSVEGRAVQRVIQYYAAVGVEAAYRFVERALYESHCRGNQIEAAWWGGDRTVLPIVAPGIFLGTQIDRPWACGWGLWRNDASDPNGEKPPSGHWIWDIWDIWDQIAVQPDENQRNLLFRQILDIWATELPMIGYLGELPRLVIVKNGFHNYVAGYPIDDPTADEHLLNPETYFWDSNLAPALSVNYATGRPGSFLTVTGASFPPNSTAMITINGYVIGTLLTDASGHVEFVLNTSQANLGYYDVTVSVNPSATASFQLTQDEPQRPKESSAPELNVPGGIAINKVYLPLVRR